MYHQLSVKNHITFRGNYTGFLAAMLIFWHMFMRCEPLLLYALWRLLPISHPRQLTISLN